MSSTYSPIDSEFEITFKLSPFHQSTPTTTTTATTTTATTTTATTTKATIDYNRLDYELSRDEDSPIYIFNQGLFKRSLLSIFPNKEREMLLTYTL